MPELTALDPSGLPAPVLPPPHFDVFVFGEHEAHLDGERVGVADGQSVHEAILDLLQQHARDCRGPVRATVFDRPHARTVCIEVAPDGSSRIPGPDEEGSWSAAPSAEGESYGSHRGPAPVSHRDPAPAAVAERVQHIREAVDGGDTEHAGLLAAALRERLTGDHGAGHPQALEARAMEAYVAHLAGDHPLATSLAIGVARIRCGLGDARAADDVLRATAAWERLLDERAVSAHGRELLHLWTHVAGKRRLDHAHAEAMRLVRQHFIAPDTGTRGHGGRGTAVPRDTCAL
ncbi:hypothetical protein G3I47_16750 [Streptomyces anulatus]|nr:MULTISPECIES: hypothetical protein [Streptomyces]NDZ58907.1 hypothetical protein [Streptomyces anulatus]OWA24940.1 hypothetical protein B9W61_10675 [Streptomyces sp. CS057]